EMKSYIRFLAGQHAAVPLPHGEDLSAYDVMVSSFPATVEAFKRDGLRAHLCRLAFEPRVLSSVGRLEKTWDISFIGSFSSVHSSRTALLDTLCRRFPQLKIWSPTIDQVPRTSPIRSHYAGQAWGRQMYDILRASRLTLNHHGDVAPYANNMRLYEATGMGTCLLTDWKANLNDMFEPGKEVVAYRDPEECVELTHRYLKDDEAREAIGCAGQSRTLREHTYSHRMQEFVGILETYM
ncbi:MAG TPA: glycosyltransferase, partial [Nitrospira sp.]|nr:glycosyltransferase [Nitrospira sp.]